MSLLDQILDFARRREAPITFTKAEAEEASYTPNRRHRRAWMVEQKKRGAGWTRPFRKGRVQR